jgi:serine/threonine-protein kinase
MTSPGGKYRIVRRLASGGMAEVFRAQVVGPEGFEKDVCLKRVLPHLARDSEFVEMFKAEARLAAKLQHTNIVQIFDFGEEDGSYYLAMEYVDGRDLRGILKLAQDRSRVLPPGLAAFITAEAAKGLSYAHTRREGSTPLNIVHRDISPHNILISWNGEVKVADFGIAKAASRASATRTGVLKGKIAYMSPEQARGDTVDARSDLFSLGLVLYEMLTGTRPFQGATETETLGRVLHHNISPPLTLNPDIPEPLSQLTMHSLERDRTARFATAEEMSRELSRFLFTLPPEEATASALAAFLADLHEGADLPEEPGHTQLAGDAVQSPTITAGGPYPVGRPGDPTRVRDDTIDSAPVALTRSEVVRGRKLTRSRRPAVIAAVVVVVVGGGAAAGMLWWFDEPSSAKRGHAVSLPSPAPAPVAAVLPAGPPPPPPPPAPAPAPAPPPAPKAAAPEPAVPTPTPKMAVASAVKPKSKPRSRSKPAASAFALTVTSRPKAAMVQVDGEEARVTPFTLRGLKAGQQISLSATAPKHRPLRTTITVEKPEETRRLALEPLPGTLQVTAIPWAEIFIDGKLISEMPQAGIEVKAGVRRVRLRNVARGFDRTFDVPVPPGGAKRFVHDLDNP